MEQTLEDSLNGVLSKIREDMGKELSLTLPWSNSPLIMYLCGSKGNIGNLC